MASAPVAAAFLQRLRENWTETPIVGPNEGGDAPADGGAFLTIEFPFADEEQITIGAPGANVFAESGACRMILSIPIGQGMKGWDAKFDTLRVAFRGKTFAGITTWSASPPALDDQSDEAGYFVLSSAIPYRFDVFG